MKCTTTSNALCTRGTRSQNGLHETLHAFPETLNGLHETLNGYQGTFLTKKTVCSFFTRFDFRFSRVLSELFSGGKSCFKMSRYNIHVNTDI